MKRVNGENIKDENSIQNSTEKSIIIDRKKSELESEESNTDPPPTDPSNNNVYTAFSTTEKRGIIFLIAVAGFFSPFTAFIYFPALESIAVDLNVSIQLINVTITMYLVIQGIIPSIFGNLADVIGRRPIYIIAFSIYLCASLGLAFQKSYAALLVLRMLQSAGSSGTIMLAYGVIADIAPPQQRGGYVGIAHVGFNSAPSLGPIVGGIMSDKLGWRWVFRLLCIISGVWLVVIFVFLPETGRRIVGNGRIPTRGIHKSILQRLLSTKNKSRGSPDQLQGRRKRPLSNLVNPLRSIQMIFHRSEALVLFSNAIFYMQYSCVQASLSTLFTRIYGLNEIQVGLSYLAFGIACAIASYGVGRITDRDYRIIAASYGFTTGSSNGEVLSSFPLEKARLRTVWYYIAISSASTLGYGWALQEKAHLAVPLVLQALIGLTVTGIFNVLNTLMVDLHSEDSATASAAVSITRCSVAAVGVSVLQIMFDHMGVGWTFTIIGGLCFATVPLLLVERSKGMRWREERQTRRENTEDLCSNDQS
ncbi:hypothetical protein VTN00DRAFT_2632 [Thermoascus crustaceus]|uniref:uncharacterized protein n=1 Tax=Thermoascus crustaceus TaxID=5088 RepID=UPI003742C3D0